MMPSEAKETGESLAHIQHLRIDFEQSISSFCSRLQFPVDKKNAVLRIGNSLWDLCMSTSLNNLSAATDRLQALLIQHSVHRPPLSEAILTYSDCQAVLDFFLRSFFAHYKMYKLACTKQLKLQIGFTCQQDDPPSSRRPLSPSTSLALKRRLGVASPKNLADVQQLSESSATEELQNQSSNDQEETAE
eukprot:m.136178 g.136178  ORF g.136178 m.136178 type:complete len:189 (-) comp15867_c0_seq1:312-878(-)